MEVAVLKNGSNQLVTPSAPYEESKCDPETHHEILVDGRYVVVPKEGELTKTVRATDDLLKPQLDFQTPPKLTNVQRLSDGSTTASNSSGSPTNSTGSPERVGVISDSEDSDDEDGGLVLDIGGLKVTARRTGQAAAEGLKEVRGSTSNSGFQGPPVVAVEVSSGKGIRERREMEMKKAFKVILSTPSKTYDELCVLFDMVGVKYRKIPSKPEHPTFSGAGSSFKEWHYYNVGKGRQLNKAFKAEDKKYDADMKRYREVAKRVLADPRVMDELNQARARFKAIMGFDYGRKCVDYYLLQESMEVGLEREREVLEAKKSSGLCSIIGVVQTLRTFIVDDEEREKYPVLALARALISSAGV